MRRRRSILAGKTRLAVALALLAIGVISGTRSKLAGLYDGWAGLLIALSACRDPLPSRLSVMMTLYAVLPSIRDHAITFHLAVMIALTILVGQAFEPHGLRDLVVVVFDKQRITVTRLAR